MLACALAAAIAAAPPARTDTPAPAPILARAAAYVARFERDFALIISDEDYTQKVSVVGYRGTSQKRHTRSEMLFMRLPDEDAWLHARNVVWLDGNRIPDSAQRLEEALRDPNANDRLEHLRRLRDEAARFNLGTLTRNSNFPTLVLWFLEADMQRRFTFTTIGRERIHGVDAWKIAYDERQEPTAIQDREGHAQFSRGTIWITDDGTVLRTALTLTSGPLWTVEMEVSFRRDAKLEMWVPDRMEETYTRRFGRTTQERIECAATYSNFRRFETSARIVQ